MNDVIIKPLPYVRGELPVPAPIRFSRLETAKPMAGLKKGAIYGTTFLASDGYQLEYVDRPAASVRISHPDQEGRVIFISWAGCYGEEAGYKEPATAQPAALALPAPPTYPAPANTVPVDMSPEEREALIARTRRDPDAIPAALRPPAGSETVTSYLTKEQAAGMSASALEAARADGAVIEGETLSAAEPATSAQTPSAKAPKDSSGGYPGQKKR
jgi:hypothetical protein